ncbi:hypothetical protein GCM10010967_11180 [Dyadobacter beijingensis]|uniref:Fungal lipase-type domain-containing protein n=1 Tax=Dyadobacter beijingensis TaxID=365489 RepID=A0ABQ2HJF9_9BACT|nr:hypothetical protein [Dyadobacter beijingensis]GGM81132.1 hypothetical protein GCM10010967_11180 [Dyadobacter beijingensis]
MQMSPFHNSRFPFRVPQVVFLLAFIWLTPVMAQPGSGKLKPGFDKAEYTELLYMHALLYDSVAANVATPKFVVPKPTYFKSLYRSPVMGLDNKWELWKSDGPVAVINIRGTTVQPVGWLENFYAAMVPARGELKLSNSFTFQYDLANHPRAGVHVGWLIGTAFLAQDILPKIDSLYKAGVTDFIVMGHSQGGAIAYLMNSHLHSLQKQGKIPKDIRFKAYCSASPKAGNTYYGYEYEAMIDGGWGYNVINSADWIPEVPFSVQTLDDFNETNPFKDINGVIKKQKLIARIAMRHAYKSMRKPSEKARRNYRKYLGDYAGKMVRKTLPEFQPPAYFNSANYVRIGPTIVLLADNDYYQKFPDSKQNVFIHHLMAPYLYLLANYQH